MYKLHVFLYKLISYIPSLTFTIVLIIAALLTLVSYYIYTILIRNSSKKIDFNIEDEIISNMIEKERNLIKNGINYKKNIKED